MKKMNGPDVVNALRQRPESAHVPIIFITGTRVVMTDEYKNLGVIGVIPKPFDIGKLADEIARLWAAHRETIIKAG
jgi:CheY-like chemotaxis protein